jgi:hypothetical protein
MAVAHMDGLTLPELDIVTDGLLAYAQSNVDFTDAHNACWMRGGGCPGLRPSTRRATPASRG